MGRRFRLRLAGLSLALVVLAASSCKAKTKPTEAPPARGDAAKPALPLIAGDETKTCFVQGGVARCTGQLNLTPEPKLPETADIKGLKIEKLSFSPTFACALLARTGKVFCWGDHTFGTLGDGRLGTRAENCDIEEPGFVAGLSGAIDIATGLRHACAVTRRGEVWCWGDAYNGKLADVPDGIHARPVKITGVANAAAVAATEEATSVLRADGTVLTWGVNADGGLGMGDDTVASKIPLVVADVEHVVEIVAGRAHTCVRVSDGHVQCWGANAQAQIGLSEGEHRTPRADEAMQVTGLRGVTDIAAGASHTCALREDGRVSCWGANDYGQLGDGSTETRDEPVEVEGVRNAVSLGAADTHGCTFDRNNDLKCWGRNHVGQVGDPISERSLVAERMHLEDARPAVWFDAAIRPTPEQRLECHAAFDDSAAAALLATRDLNEPLTLRAVEAAAQRTALASVPVVEGERPVRPATRRSAPIECEIIEPEEDAARVTKVVLEHAAFAGLRFRLEYPQVRVGGIEIPNALYLDNRIEFTLPTEASYANGVVEISRGEKRGRCGELPVGPVQDSSLGLRP